MRPLNIFQRCIRVWEEAHPYNAAQVLHVAGAADVGRISAAWNEVLAASGLGNVRVAGRWFCYEKAPRQEVAVVEGALEGFITRELNRPFGGGDGCATMPFRAFVVPGGDGGHYMGVVYQHWVADSVAMRMLLREWFCRLHDPARVMGRPVHVPRGGFWRYFGPGRGGWNLVEGAVSVVHATGRFAGVRRIEEENCAQRVDVALHRLPEGMAEALLEVARRRGVRLNDLFLAALARACDEHGAAPRRSGRDLALGTIVDLRGQSAENLDETFGMFLGFTAVVVRGEHLRDRERVLASIGWQSAEQKEGRAAQVSMLRMAAGYAQAQFLTREKLAAFYRNYMPLSGGVSNVNMNRSWAAEYHPGRLLEYLRVAPTGPMVPLVVAVTTIGRRFSFALTRRAALVDEQRGKQLAEMFVDELTARVKMG